MPVQRAWRDYVAASQRFAAVCERLHDRLAFFAGDPPAEVPRSLSPRDTATWLELTKDVELAATIQRRTLEDYISARETARGR